MFAFAHMTMHSPFSTVPPPFYRLMLLCVMQIGSDKMNPQWYTSHLTMITLLVLLSFMVVLLWANSDLCIDEIAAETKINYRLIHN